MQLLFVADPPQQFKPAKDSTLAMMRAASARGAEIWCCEPRHLRWRGGAGQAAGLLASAQRLQLRDHDSDWFGVAEHSERTLHSFAAVLMRKDPPFDAEYLYATHLLQQAERQGARVFNSAQALRDHPEKLAILEWPELIPTTLVSREPAQLRAFALEQGDVIVKPLDGMGGSGIFRLRTQADGSPDPNLGAVLETLTLDGERTIMAQRYLPAIAQGDKRILLIDGQPLPYALARLAQGGETRANLAAGGIGQAQPLSASDRAIAAAVGPTLAARGLFLVGLDVIGDRLTEINVTSPTCFVEIAAQTGLDVAGQFIDALLARLGQ